MYSLHEGDRIEDALSAAGGAATDADRTSLNLALRVRDQDQLACDAKAVRRSQLIDGHAGSGPEDRHQLGQRGRARRAARHRRGLLAEDRRFAAVGQGRSTSTEELVERKVIPTATYDKIKDLITVGAVTLAYFAAAWFFGTVAAALGWDARACRRGRLVRAVAIVAASFDDGPGMRCSSCLRQPVRRRLPPLRRKRDLDAPSAASPP